MYGLSFLQSLKIYWVRGFSCQVDLDYLSSMPIMTKEGGMDFFDLQLILVREKIPTRL